MFVVPLDENDLRRAADAIASADALIIGAGAGMGVDSGLPDFRGREGFWKAYPPYARLRLDFSQLASPQTFRQDPKLAWGFYGHRLNLYRKTRPHEGFAILQKWAGRMKHGAFVYTSNVDGQFQRASFPEERIVEVHGAIDWMQCTLDCGVGIFPADGFEVVVDERTMLAVPPLPACPVCQALARPNILMFGDGSFDETRTAAQREAFHAWARRVVGTRVAVVEMGAGLSIPTIRRGCEEFASALKGTLIRINTREPEVPRGQIGLGGGALDALRVIDARMGGVGT